MTDSDKKDQPLPTWEEREEERRRQKVRWDELEEARIQEIERKKADEEEWREREEEKEQDRQADIDWINRKK